MDVQMSKSKYKKNLILKLKQEKNKAWFEGQNKFSLAEGHFLRA